MNDELKELIGRAMHVAYEKAAVECGWQTQDSCKVSYDDLPAKNRFCMDASVEAAAEVIAVWLEKEAKKYGAEADISRLAQSYDGEDKERAAWSLLHAMAKQLRP